MHFSRWLLGGLKPVHLYADVFSVIAAFDLFLIQQILTLFAY